MPGRALSHRDPFLVDALDFRRNFEDFFGRFFGAPILERWSANPAVAWIPPVETFIDQNKFNVRLALPGVKPAEVNVQAHGNELTITGERKQEVVPADERSFQREITYGAFERVIPLPEGTQTDKIEARFVNGVLEVYAPLSAAALPRKIEVKEASEGRRLAA